MQKSQIIRSIILSLIILSNISPVQSNEQGFCLYPQEPYLYKIDKAQDPKLYSFTRDEFQKYFEQMEDYLRCLEHERGRGIERIKNLIQVYKRNFGNDAVFKYKVR